MAAKSHQKKDTSWNRVADWYDQLLEGEGTYQKELILPNLLRLMELRRGDAILDLACGQGFFASEFAKSGASVIGVDASPKLIALAKKKFSKNGQNRIDFRVARADALPFLKSGSINKVTIILALQNIENVAAVLHESARVLKNGTENGGKLYIVLNHPAFRIPKASDWGWDDAKKVQYRRVDRYLSELKVPIQMHPGNDPHEITISFHRPLQFYGKALAKAGFAITGLEEWNSHKKSQPGPRAKAEDDARKEIPLFICLVAQKMKDA